MEPRDSNGRKGVLLADLDVEVDFYGHAWAPQAVHHGRRGLGSRSLIEDLVRSDRRIDTYGLEREVRHTMAIGSLI